MSSTSTDRSARGGSSGSTSTATPVLHVITGTTRRGAETFAVDLSDALIERGRRGRTVALTADAGGAGLDVPALGGRPLGIDTLRALRREVKRAHVVVAHGSSAVVACAFATLGTRVPFVYRNIGDPSFWLDTPRRRRQMRWILGRAAATVALWDGSARALESFAGRALDVRVIPTGVPAGLFPPVDAKARAVARARLGVGDRGLVAVYVGSLSSEKNVAAAVAAVASIPDAELLLVGDGPDRAMLAELADRSAPGRVGFLGTRERPREEMAAADVLVLPSHTEGIPAVLIEAAFSGLPVVASAVGGIPEVVENGVTGFTVPPGDVSALAEALRGAAANGAAFGSAGRRRCLERFEIGVVAEAWDALLADLGAWGTAR
jgi:glycosyltransferase involved in cell wall biosynthesis